MNDDLILRARLEEAGHYQDDIVKIYGGAGAAAEKFYHRLPFIGAKMQDRALGRTPGTTLADKHKIKAEKQQRRKQAYEDAQTAKGNMPIDYGQNVTAMDKPLPNVQTLEGSPVTTGQLAQAEKTAQQNKPTQPEQSNYPVLMPKRNADGAPAQPDAQPAPEQQPQQPQQPVQGGNMGLSSNVQDMAQQFQAGQDMQTIQQGKGAEKQTYMKNRSGLGKVADFLTFGATSQFGSTGGRARRKANQKSEQQTQNYQAAQNRMNQRAMGMSPVMTSFDNQLSAYDDFISLRKGIQERNTTINLRR